MKKLINAIILVWLAFIFSNVSYAESGRKADLQKLIGTWTITNETTEETYAGTIGEVTFYDGYFTLDYGRFAAAGIVSGSEDSYCHIPLDPILFKFIGKSVIYVSWTGENRSTGNTYPSSSILTIVKKKHNQYTIIGEGGCGATAPRISYLEKIE
jgi:hypothetical protein